MAIQTEQRNVIKVLSIQIEKVENTTKIYFFMKEKLLYIYKVRNVVKTN